MTDRLMTYDVGRLRFAWNIVSREIEVYEMNGEQPIKRIGWLFAEREGEVVEFEPESFHALCDEFLQMASVAEIRDDSEEFDVS